MVQSGVVRREVVFKKRSQFSLETAEKSKKDTYFSFRGCGTRCGRKNSHHFRELKSVRILNGQPVVLEQECAENRAEDRG